VELPELGMASPPPTPNMVFQTTGRNSITVFGVPGGGVMLCAGPSASPSSPRIMITQAGITLTTGSATISLNGSAINIVGSPVTLNAGALVVT
jgi:hypothetical protein